LLRTRDHERHTLKHLNSRQDLLLRENTEHKLFIKGPDRIGSAKLIWLRESNQVDECRWSRTTDITGTPRNRRS